MGIPEQIDWRRSAIFVTILLMLGSLFISRALLSISMAAFAATTLLHKNIAQQIRSFFRDRFLAGLSLLFFIPLISGLWSTDLHEWLNVLFRKIPFLLFPLAFAGTWQLKEREWRLISSIFITLTVAACLWSMVMYLQDMDSINESYLRAKTIPTPLYDDHVRFSWLVCIAIMMSVLMAEAIPGSTRVILLAALVIMTGYLHLLSARTGLLLLYLFVFCYTIYKLRRSPRVSLFMALGLIAVIAAGWFCFPTFRNRIRYNVYDMSFVLKGEYRSGTSDGNRVASLRAGTQLIAAHPWTGVGAGDVWQEMNRWYDQHLPAARNSDRLYPSNEWIVHGCIAGWPGMLLFSVAVLMPFFVTSKRHSFYWIMFHISAMALLLIETSLETQYGIFLYTFCGLWWWKWFRSEG